MDINSLNTHVLPAHFEYHEPPSLEAAVELLSAYGCEARLLAGGTDLLVEMKQRLVEPGHIINVKNIAALTQIEEGEDGVRIGAATKLRAVERSELIRAKLPLLHEAVSSIGSVQVRNMATLGGNLCNASPAADSATALMALDAEAGIMGPEGARTVTVKDFFLGPGLTVLRPDEILVEVFTPYLPEDAGTSFIKLGRRSLDLATINIAVVLELMGGVVADCMIAMGAVAQTPVRISRVEEFLRGEKLTSEAMNVAAEMASEDIRPITDLRATAEYRLEASKALTRDALTIARRRAGEGGAK